MRLSARVVRVNYLNGGAKRNQQHADDSEHSRLEFQYARFGLRFEHAIHNAEAGKRIVSTPFHIISVAITSYSLETADPKPGDCSTPRVNSELTKFLGKIQQFSCLN